MKKGLLGFLRSISSRIAYQVGFLVIDYYYEVIFKKKKEKGKNKIKNNCVDFAL
jgi:hypothetical protein